MILARGGKRKADMLVDNGLAGRILDEGGNRKHRAEMTPEERTADNKFSKERRKQGNHLAAQDGKGKDSKGSGKGKDGKGKGKGGNGTMPAQPIHTAPDTLYGNETFVNDDGLLVNELGRIVDEEGNLKPRAEMTPEERTADNKFSKERKKQGNHLAAEDGKGKDSKGSGKSKDDKGKGKDKGGNRTVPAQPVYTAPDILHGIIFVSDDGFLVNELGRIVDEEGNRKPRAEMTPEERTADNTFSKERKKHTNATGMQNTVPMLAQPALNAPEMFYGSEVFINDDGLLVNELGRIVDEGGNLKPRAEMTPEERTADNRSSKERRKHSNASGMQHAAPMPIQPVFNAPEMLYGSEVFMSDDGMLVNELGRIVDEGGNLKPRAEMTPEERSADNKLSKERKKPSNASGMQLAAPMPAQPVHTAPDMFHGNESFVNDEGMLVNELGRIVDEGGNLKPRAEMTLEERAADNRLSKRRRKTL